MPNVIGIEDVGMGNPLLSRKSVRLLVIFTLALIVCLPIIRPFQTVSAQTDQTQYYEREFAWDYGGNHWTWNMSIPMALYAAYNAVPDSVRTQFGPQDFGFFTTTQDTYLQTLADKMNSTATSLGYSSYDEINFVLAFAQSIPYQTDNVSTGYQSYPRFPVETLVDDVGDCKSHSVLFATLTLMLGFGTVYINPPDHLAVGILGNNLQGASWTIDNRTYYYCETTGSGFKIGDLPDQFLGQTANVYEIDESRQYVPNLRGITFSNPNPSIGTSTPTPSPTGETTPTSSPDVAPPTVQPVLPMSLNLISEAPIFFSVVVAAIVICLIVAVKSVRTQKEKPSVNQTAPAEQNAVSETEEPSSEDRKFCIYCGSKNKSFAVYCEKCGKKIA